MPPYLFAALRFLAAGLITLLFVLLRRKSQFPRGWRIYMQFISIGLFNTTGVFAIVYYTEQFVPSAYAALMSATMPFMVMLLGWILKKQTITLVQVIGLALGFVGVFLIACPGFQHAIPHWAVYTGLLIFTQVLAAIGSIQSKGALEQGISPFVVNGFQVLFGGVGLLFVAWFSGTFSFKTVHNWQGGIEALLYLTVIGSMVASTIFFALVKRVGALIASTWTYVSPVIAIIVGYLWFREPIFVLTVLGTIVILVGVFMVNLKAFKAAYSDRLSTEALDAPGSQKEPLPLQPETLTMKR